MIPWLSGATSGDLPHSGRLVLSLLIAAVLGWLVSVVYRATHRGTPVPSFCTTLVLLAILIAAVTQVIGDNVARAFSLVGTLSIVRFRTVVQDTRDISFVILSVAIGMALGAGDFWVAGATLGVVTVVAAVLAGKRSVVIAAETPYQLSLTVGLGNRAEDVVAAAFSEWVARSTVTSVSTASKGAALETVYELYLRPDVSPGHLVEALNGTQGVLGVHLKRRD